MSGLERRGVLVLSVVMLKVEGRLVPLESFLTQIKTETGTEDKDNGFWV